MIVLFLAASPCAMANLESNSCSSLGIEEQDATASITKDPSLLIFVSFSMSKNSLVAWSEQASKAGGRLVMRGFKDNSPKATIQHLINTLGENGAGNIIIDPTYFEQFNITKVPAVVVTEGAIVHCNEAECKTPHHDVLYGDVGLKYALEHLTDKGDYGNVSSLFYNRLRS